jgi:phosphoglycolate phosphatase-like HAD superfamily hydrolase
VKVVFDLDGVIAATAWHLEHATVAIIQYEYGLTETTARACYRSTFGMPFREQLEELFPGDSRNEAAVEKFTGALTATYAVASAHDDVARALGYLDVHGVPYAICSSSPVGLAVGLVYRILPRFPGKILGIEYGGKDVQLERLALEHRDLTFIGCAPHDADYAVRAGVRFLGLEREPFTRDHFHARGLRSVATLGEAVREVLPDIARPATNHLQVRGDATRWD